MLGCLEAKKKQKTEARMFKGRETAKNGNPKNEAANGNSAPMNYNYELIYIYNTVPLVFWHPSVPASWLLPDSQ